jgi:hypothetical protein
MVSRLIGENFSFLVMLTIFAVLIAGNAVAYWKLFQGKR